MRIVNKIGCAIEQNRLHIGYVKYKGKEIEAMLKLRTWKSHGKENKRN